MLAYHRGDASAFECLYRRHKDGLFAFLYRSCPHTAVAEDVAQEAWEAVINNAAHYEPRASFKTWLYQIGRNRMVDHLRRRANHTEPLDSAPEPAAGPTDEDFNAMERQVLAAVGALPRDQRDAVLLKEQGFSIAEIAEITRAGQETVKSRLRYGRSQLREQLGTVIGDRLGELHESA